MEDREIEFLAKVFTETGAHIRATDRKSLAVTGAYIGLFSIFLSTLAHTCLTGSSITFSWLSVAIQTFFLLVGTCIYVMQQWYRAWKEHYLEVSLAIRKEFINDERMSSNHTMFPYWLRRGVPESRISIDNILKHLTVAINFILVLLISYQVLELHQNRNLAILIVILIVLVYIGMLFVTQIRIRKGRNLFA
jgi:hypothetical protein